VLDHLVVLADISEEPGAYLDHLTLKYNRIQQDPVWLPVLMETARKMRVKPWVSTSLSRLIVLIIP